MADGTRSQDLKKLEESVRALKEHQERTTRENEEIRNSLKGLGEIKEMLSAVTLKYDQMAAYVYGRQPQEASSGELNTQLRAGSSQPQLTIGFGTRYAKIDFPKFLVKILLDGYTNVKVSWETFKQGIISRFGPDVFEDAVGELTKLKQTSSVKEYQEKFEFLANKTHKLPESFFISCFISGLKEEIKANVLMFRPTQTSLKPLVWPNYRRIALKLWPRKLGFTKRELPKDLEEKKAKDGGNKRILIQKCQKREERIDEALEQEGDLQISINALTGSTHHNFLNQEVVKRAGVETTEINPLTVFVADGTKLVSTATCKGFKWEMQGVIFQTDMRVLPLKGCDMVLGIQWLATLGPVKWDFKNLSMDFTLNNRRHVLRGGKQGELKENLVADALSRREDLYVENATFHQLVSVDSTWLPKVQLSWQTDSDLQQLIARLTQDNNAHPGFLWTQGILTYKGSLVVGASTELKNQIITAYHSSAMGGHSVYGQPPPDHNFMNIGTSQVAAVENWARERASILRMLKENLQQAQHRMKHYANKLRTEREFAIGDWVYLRLQPYRQSSVALQRSMKLSPRFYGPFQVLSKVGTVAYELKLPDSAHIHPVFHVSLLKKKLGQHVTPNPILPPVSDEGVLQMEPVAVLDRRMVKRNNEAVVQWLVQWSRTFPEDATWIDYDEFHSKFPDFQP
ncbi:hypothetical protein Acr_00g0100660 [Actinidia rufa]|uniref:Retrotransposon gag domain-containing protein n=1 Tax=Actinidia rufa TaxID=165716 RepID=A0A7J0DZY6_9ERIC|nr:hypothetical protein Acr_00g0100660 [Actinidia rufa]